ncbi:hypothetical protein DFH07DRAFT_778846 [Mycena maculata]|uniref:AAA-ATPase-like domain-containing protein n=1 Tax=Mycena maculata TaxID=230809 RepID=A0AAD7MYW0_9AGAR|nr:hypothetical protein DFH07DRAFT_778846 [Mycena maculata]
MLPREYVRQYFNSSGDADMIQVLFECTFDKADQWYKDLTSYNNSAVPAKRGRSLLEDGAPGSADGLVRVIPSTNNIPINIPDPSFTFPSHIHSTRIAIVDKTRFIPALDDLLGRHPGCMIISPKGTGKSVLVSMLHTWYDCESDARRYFKDLDIDKIGKKRAKANTLPDSKWSARSCLCLVFDLAKIDKPTGGDPVSLSIQRYICRTIRAFVVKYREQLGVIEFSPQESQSPDLMLYTIAGRLKNMLFICVDHWDGPFLAALGSNDAVTAAIAATLTSFLEGLLAPYLANNLRVKLLIIGNIPVFGITSITNITLHRSMVGALGMDSKELENLFSVLSRGRQKQLSMNENGLRGTLGCFSPPRITPDDDPPPIVYTFTLVFHYVANILDLRSGHRTPPHSPLFGTISELCTDLLEHSSLRRGRTVLVAPFRQITPVSLTTFVKHEEALWRLLFYLGALVRATNPGDQDPDPMWTMEISSPLAHIQLFSSCTRIPHSVHESERETQLRSLLERNPRPMMETIANQLEFTPLLDLYEMSEAVFQTLFNCYMADEKKTYLNNYFPQLGLLLDPSKLRGQYSQAGQGRYGYLDIFMCGLRPGRVVAIELKYISLCSLFRAAMTGTNGFVNAEFDRETSLLKIEEIAKLPIEKLRQVKYHYYDRRAKMSVIRPINELLKEAEIQLKSYMNAIAEGEATNDAKKGITRAERRVQVAKTQSSKDADEVIGFIVCGIGRRIITIPVEPDVHNTKYRYREQPGWQKTWERHSASYRPNN